MNINGYKWINKYKWINEYRRISNNNVVYNRERIRKSIQNSNKGFQR